MPQNVVAGVLWSLEFAQQSYFALSRALTSRQITFESQLIGPAETLLHERSLDGQFLSNFDYVLTFDKQGSWLRLVLGLFHYPTNHFRFLNRSCP